jgi:cysteine desulfurase
MKIYLDNAATTGIDPIVLEEMMPFLTSNFGNPSSIHEYGRKSRAAIEKSRKIIAQALNASSAEIFFTSCGTESNNMILKQAVEDLGVKRIISSPIEHHCVLHSLETLARKGIEIKWLSVDNEGNIDMGELEQLLKESSSTLVTIMHANNEIGTIAPIDAIGKLCKQYDAYFHSDTVQTVAHYKIDLQATSVDFISGSAHKFHGPKGIGFVFIRSSAILKPYIHGGSQERNMRAGTENVAGIVGIGKAMELWENNRTDYMNKIMSLKSYFAEKVKNEIPSAIINGKQGDKSLYHVLSIALPENTKTDLLLFNLDIAGICASGASACASGSLQASHVMEAIHAPLDKRTVRFSFSKDNTIEEIDKTVEVLKTMVL